MTQCAFSSAFFTLVGTHGIARSNWFSMDYSD